VKPGGRSDHPIELLSAALDRELGPAETAALEAHLEGCAECRGLGADFRRLDQAMAEEPPAAVPADLRDRILASLPPLTAAPASPWWRQAMPLAAAASLVMVVLVWYGRPDRLPPLSGSAAPKSAPRADAPVPAAPAAAEPDRTGLMLRDSPGARAKPVPPAAPPAREAEKGVFRTQSGVPSTRAQAAPREADEEVLAPESAMHAPEVGRGPSGNWKVEQESDKAKDKASAATADMNEKLRSLGYIGDLKKEKADAAPPAEARNRELKEAAGSPAPAAAQLASRIAPAAAVPGAPKSVGLLAAPYRIRVDAERTMSLTSGTWSCGVILDEADMKTLEAAIQESLRTFDHSNVPARDTDGTVIIPATPGARDAVLRLVQERYRPVIEARCGPLPRSRE
jgi:hypothetical protein